MSPHPLPPADLEAFARDLAALRSQLEADIGPADLAHLRRMIRWGRLCALVGLATACLAPNPLSAALLAQASTVRWAVVLHHIGHRAYERIPGAPEHYRGSRFAAGWRRYLDFLDWILPEAWRWEHNAMHHPRTGEPADPDFVQRNVDWLRRSSLPRPVKWAVVAFFACTWKLLYYAPNTFQLLRRHQQRRPGAPAETNLDDLRYADSFDPRQAEGRAFWRTCVLPYAALRFALIPALFLLLGTWIAACVLINLLLAELLTNVQTFLLITPSHAAEDLPRFRGRAASPAEFAWRQIAGTTNYADGGDLVAFLHAWTNYHIEHHLWPDLPVLKYMQAAAPLRALCARHGVPYCQESVFQRARKTFAIMTGDATMHAPGEPRDAPAIRREPAHTGSLAPSPR